MSWIFYNPNAVEPPEEQDEPEMYCPICGEPLYADDEVYESGGEIIGCQNCVESRHL